MEKIENLLKGVKKNVSLKNYTTFKIGGSARYFFVAETKEDLVAAVLAAEKLHLPLFILGAGSNLLVSDDGFNGLVIKIRNTEYKMQDNKIFAGAGAKLGDLVNVLSKNNLAGLEWAIGIPGTLGGAIFGNAGAFGKAMKGIVRKVEVFNVQTGKIEFFKNKDCKFRYRESVFKKRNNLIIVSAVLQLKKRDENKIKETIKKYLFHKKETQPLNFPSAGSIFKNPSKFSAGELIEKCGLKGERIGGAKISEKHANFIVNCGKASAKDVKRLINLAKKLVKMKFGIVLEEEIQILSYAHLTNLRSVKK